jgi:hypothetical protein
MPAQILQIGPAGKTEEYLRLMDGARKPTVLRYKKHSAALRKA